MYGIEIDMLALGDADCLIVTQWLPTMNVPVRVLIDGGSGADSEIILDFLRSQGYLHPFDAVVCTHLHNDHARGLIKVVRDPRFNFQRGWMHDIRQHTNLDMLRRATSGNSPEAEAVRQVAENTKELASAFAYRGVTPMEPFAGAVVSRVPHVTVLGPSLPYYTTVLQEFTKINTPAPSPLPSLWQTLAVMGLEPRDNTPSMGLAGIARLGDPISLPGLAGLSKPSPAYPNLANMLPFTGALSKSSVQENPVTQPFNNTSVIIGCLFNGKRLLFTGDAGADALGRIPAEWNHLTWMQIPHHGSDGNLSQALIERFCPAFANISACGDSSHPDRAIVSGLIKVGANVFSTHSSGNLRFTLGNVPYRKDYVPAIPLKGTGSPQPLRLGDLLKVR